MRRPMLKLALKSASRRSGVAAALLAATILLAQAPCAAAAETRHCLSGEEQRAAIAAGKTVPLATAIHALHRLPKEESARLLRTRS